MPCVDPKTIGAGRQYQDSEEAERANGGTYADAVVATPPERKIPCGPRAPAPSVFGGLTKSNGGNG